MLTTHSAMEFSDVTFLVDNDAVFSICKDKLEVELFSLSRFLNNLLWFYGKQLQMYLLSGSNGFLQRAEPTDSTSEIKMSFQKNLKNNSPFTSALFSANKVQLVVVSSHVNLSLPGGFICDCLPPFPRGAQC